IHVLQGERKMAQHNVTLGRFQLTGIPSAPRGVPQVEVTFDIDVNGIVHVAAKDLATSKEQKITITSSSGLSDDEIEKMVQDAEKFAEEDEIRLKEIETRNNADSMIYQADKTLKEFADKIDEETKGKIETAKEELNQALQGDDMADIEAKTEALTEAVYAFTAKMYENINQQEQEPGSDEVFDADYNIPDDDK
ncbi:MAG TPA: molecular chaperone DnaK, partial [Syntrophomonas sp.]|nr:molecular chaperone DnaK [Syntrophomonas sp.]